MQLLNKKRDYIDRLMNFTAQASTTDLQRVCFKVVPWRRRFVWNDDADGISKKRRRDWNRS